MAMEKKIRVEYTFKFGKRDKPGGLTERVTWEDFWMVGDILMVAIPDRTQAVTEDFYNRCAKDRQKQFDLMREALKSF